MFRLTILALALATPLPAFAENGGDRMPAGGAFMSSYSRDAYAPRGPGASYDRGTAASPDVSATASTPPETARLRGRAPRR